MKNAYKYTISYVAGLVNGVLGSGGGIIALPMLYKVLDNEKNAHNNVCFFILPLSIVSAAICRNSVALNVILPVCIGAFLGGLAGVVFSKKISVKYLKILFALVIIYTGVSGLL